MNDKEIMRRLAKNPEGALARFMRVIDYDPTTEDGGAGSGNWGHKGRIGKRGGSGKGGGKHNREGTKETGYRHTMHKMDDPGDVQNAWKHKTNQGGMFNRQWGWGSKAEKFQPKTNPASEKPAKREIVGGSWTKETTAPVSAHARALAGGVKEVNDDVIEYVEHHLSNMLAGTEPLEPVLEYEYVNSYMTAKMNTGSMRQRMDDFLKGNDGGLTKEERSRFFSLLNEGAEGLEEGSGVPSKDFTWRDVNRARVSFSVEDRGKGKEFMSLCNKILGGYDPETKEEAKNRTQTFMKKANWIRGLGYKQRQDLEHILRNANMLTGSQKLTNAAAAANIEERFAQYDQDNKPKMFAYCEYMKMKASATETDLSEALQDKLSDDEFKDLIKTLDKIRKTDDIVYDEDYFEYLKTRIFTNATTYEDQKLMNYIAKALDCPQVRVTAASGEVTKSGFREKIKQKIESAKTADEVNAALQESGVFKRVRIGFGNGEGSKGAARAAMRVTDNFPFMVGKLGSLNAENLGYGTNGQCTTMAADHPISINMAEFNNPSTANRQLADSIKSNWSPKIDPSVSAAEYVVTHEMGHALDGVISLHLGMTEWDDKLFGKKKDNIYSADLMSRVMTACGYTQHGKRGFADTDVDEAVSRYAHTNAREWFAECLSEGLLSSNPRPVAKKFMEELRKDLVKFGLDTNLPQT